MLLMEVIKGWDITKPYEFTSLEGSIDHKGLFDLISEGADKSFCDDEGSGVFRCILGATQSIGNILVNRRKLVRRKSPRCGRPDDQ